MTQEVFNSKGLSGSPELYLDFTPYSLTSQNESQLACTLAGVFRPRRK